MSKFVKEMMVREYRDRFSDISQALIVDIRGIEANENNALRLELHAKNIRVSVLRNTLAKMPSPAPIWKHSCRASGPHGTLLRR